MFMDMSFPFDLADSNIVDGRLDHRSLLASAISRQANGTTARLMLRDGAGALNKRNTASVNPLHARIRYFARKSHGAVVTQIASGCFYISSDADHDREIHKDELVVYQDASVIGKHPGSKEYKSEIILISEGQENLRQI